MLMENGNKCLSSKPAYIYDEACLDVYNVASAAAVEIAGQYVECHGCRFERLAVVQPGTNTSLLIDTRYVLRLNYTYGGVDNCTVEKLFYEHYRYGWNLTDDGGKCESSSAVYIKEPADSAYLPILAAFIVLFTFGTLWYLIKCVYKCTKNDRRWRRWFFTTDTDADAADADDHVINASSTHQLVIERAPPIRKHPHRVKSIDVFRGLCIVLMIFVNYGGGQYWFFKHSVWNGLTFADLVFPWFLWIMGMSLTISLNGKLRRAAPRRQLVFRVVRRSLVLIAVGVVLNSHSQRDKRLADLRFPGVLQRIGVVYLVVGLLETTFAKRTISVNEYGRLSFLQDVIVAAPQWATVVCLVVVHAALTFFLDVPGGCGRGYLGPGGLADGGRRYNCTGGAAGHVDRLVFGEHMYKTPTCRALYETTVYYDPEGILGTLTSVLLVYFGVQAGRILHTYSNVRTRVIRWCVWGVTSGLIGGALAGFTKNDGPLPINKNLSSLSFVLVAGGLAFLLEAYLFVFVDILRKWGGRPLFYPGMNPLVLYVGHEMFKGTFPFAWTPTYQSHANYLCMNLWGTAVWVVVAIVLYKRNVFVSI